MSQPERIDQLFADAHDILRISQEVLQAAHAHVKEVIQQRDEHIAQLQDQIYELRLRIEHQESLAQQTYPELQEVLESTS